MSPAVTAALVLIPLAFCGVAPLRRAGWSDSRIATICAPLTAAATVLVICTVPGAVAASAVSVTLTSSTSLGTLSTQMTTNNTWSGLVDQNATSKANFAALKLPLVRLHVGDDGYPVAMPEVKQNQWSFAALDTLVNDETSIGQEPVMNIKFAPDWMWTCTTPQAAGDVRDKTFKTFADYMARLVSYYNKGSMTTETGQVITNPAGTKNRITYWELWNEPDLNNETPCAPADGLGLSPSEYLTMWNAVAPAMLAVDPTLKFIGPATAGGQFGSGTGGANNDYITQLMQSGNPKPYALSFHGYGYWDNSVTDNTMFVGDGTPGINGGIDDIVAAAHDVHASYPGVPIWITEVNVNAAWGNDPRGRPWGPFAAAWWGTAFVDLVPENMALIHQYDVSSQEQFGLISDQDGTTRLPYWIVKTLNAAFPVNSTRLQMSSPDPSLKVMAARRPDGKISILVVDKRVDSANPSGGVGLPADVNVGLDATPTSVTLQQIDSSTSASTGPATVNMTPSQTLSLHFPGYGLAVLTVATGPAPTPAPAVTLSATSLSFASQLLGSKSAAQTTTLTNSGNAALSISGISLAGTNASDFAQTNTCPSSSSTLTAGASCTVSVTFSPSAAGSRSASLTIADNAANSPQSVGLSGTGSAPLPGATVSPTSLSFGSLLLGSTSAAKTATLTNSGTAPLSISGISVAGTNASDFAQTDTCPSSPSALAVGASCTISVTFAPSASGSRSATVTITDNAAGSPQTVTLGGTGSSPVPAVTLTPTNLSFASQLAGTQAAVKTATLTNSGTGPLSISSIALAGFNPLDFSQTNTCPSSPVALPVGASCTISVTFSPSVAGSRNASLSIVDDAANSPQSIALSGTGTTPAPAVSLTPTSLSFGSQVVGSTSPAQSVTLTNAGTAALTLTNIAVGGTNASDFAETTTCPSGPSTLAVGASCTISFTFSPSASGSRSANLTLTDNASGSPQSLSLGGTGSVPTAALAPTSLTFASQLVGATSAAKTATLTNSGTAPLSITSITLAGSNASDFSQTNTCPSSPVALPVGASCTVSVTFSPSAAGSRNASVSVNDDAASSPQSIALSGTGQTAAPGVSLSPAGLTFGSQLVGSTSSPQSVAVTNSGSSALTISSVGLSGANAGDFSRATTCPLTPNTLAAGASCSISVTFSPSVAGARNASLTIADDATGSPQNVTLSGTGVTSTPGASVAPASLSFGSQLVGSSSSAQSVTLTNSGSAALAISSVAVSGANAGDFAPTTTCPLSPSTLAAGASCTVSVTFSPAASGARSATLTIADNAPSGPQSLPVSGTGTTAATLKTVGVWRPSNATWYMSSGRVMAWGAPGDVPAPADFNGDGKLDPATWRPSTGEWYVYGGVQALRWGRTGDVPVPADYNGDGKADYAVWRPSTGTFWVNGVLTVQLGQLGDVPAPADYNGDGKVDPAVWRPSTGTFYIYGGPTVQLGQKGDVPVPADYNGNGKADPAVWRPATATFYLRSGRTRQFGQVGDVPVPADYNGDRKADFAVWRPSTGTWYVATGQTMEWGLSGDVPISPAGAGLISAGAVAPADTTLPSTPTGLATSAIGQTSVTLGWNSSTDNVGVMGYGRYRDGNLLSSGAGTSYTFAGLTCGTTYVFGVDAYDAAGNRSGRATVNATTSPCSTVDTTAPSPPTGLSTSAISQTGVTLAWNASTDNVAVTGYGRYRNGTLLSSGTGTSFQFTGLSCGTTYTLGVDAYDAAGNRSAKASVAATTSACSTGDTTAPSTPTGLAASAIGQTSITLGWTASTDNVGVTGYGRYRNGTLLSGAAGTSYTFTGLTCGTSYTLGVDAYDAAGNRSAKASVPATTSACSTGDTTAPSTPTGLATSAIAQTSITLGWTASTDSVGVTGYGRYLNGTLLSSAAGTSFQFTGLTCATTYTLGVDAYDAAGNRSGQASVSVATSACAQPPPPPATHEYFGTLPVGSAVPRADADCASRVTRNPWEPRPENFAANHTVPTGPVPWNNNSSWTYWSAFMALRNKVTGNFTGTTDEIIQWAACKWGIDENLIRAQAVVESYWVQSTQGDLANGKYHSFGLMQVSQDDPNGNLLKGGYPYTAQDTALNVDYYGAEMRACYEGAFYDGGSWLYGGTQVKGDLWGCAGYWYSGNWYDAGAQTYIAQVKNYLNTKPWIGWGYPGK